MEEMSKHGHIGLASMRAGMDRKTGRKYVAAGQLPSEMVKEREWRTREDPFAGHWPEVQALLVETPALNAPAARSPPISPRPAPPKVASTS